MRHPSRNVEKTFGHKLGLREESKTGIKMWKILEYLNASTWM